MALRVATGSYVGDATDDRNITVSPSFAIKMVLIKQASTQPAVMSISGMGDLARILDNTTGSPAANIIQSMGTGTFQVGASSRTNLTGETYYYVALGGDDTEIYAGSYVGNATDDRAITAPGFLPELVIILPNANQQVISRFGALAGDNSQVFSGDGNALTGANYIQSLDASGFTVGTNSNVNNSGTTYYYLAVKGVSGQSNTSSYTGDSSDNRDLTTPNFQPGFVFIYQPFNNLVFRGANVGDDTSRIMSAANISNAIQSFISTGFQLGTSSLVNNNGDTYYYYALKDNPIISSTLTESFTATDSLLKSSVRTLSENTTIADVFSGIKVYTEELLESTGIYDLLFKSQSRTISETITITDTLVKSNEKTFSENTTITDLFSRVGTFVRTLTENVSILDTIIKRLNGTTTIWTDRIKPVTSWLDRNKPTTNWTPREKP